MFSLAKRQRVRNFPVFLLWSISHLITPPSLPPPRGKRKENVSVPVSTFQHFLSLTFPPKYFTFFSFFPKQQLKQMNIPKLSLDLLQINMQHFLREGLLFNTLQPEGQDFNTLLCRIHVQKQTQRFKT